MQLKKYTDFGLRILMYMSVKGPEHIATIREICDVYNLSANHVNKVVHHLGKLTLIETRRGKNGGFLLAKRPVDINLGVLVRQLEGDEYWINCKNPPCRLFPECDLKHIINQGKELFYQHLNQYSVADLVDNRVGDLL